MILCQQIVIELYVLLVARIKPDVTVYKMWYFRFKT